MKNVTLFHADGFKFHTVTTFLARDIFIINSSVVKIVMSGRTYYRDQVKGL